MSKKGKGSTSKKSKNKNKKRILKKLKTPAKISFLSFLGDVQGCGTIRVIYPYLLLNHFRMKDVMVNSTYLSQYVKEPEFYKGHTFVQFQRSASEHHLSMYHHFRTNIQSKVNVPLIYEIDDMLFDIPKWNFAHDYYNKFGDHVKTMLSMANAVVVSTENLKKVYSEYNKNISVIPNHLPKFVWGDIYPAHEYYREGSKVKILWAGSQNHFSIPNVTKEDGGDFGKELVKFIKKTVDIYEWHFQGAWPLELNDVKSKVHLHDWQHIFNYPKAVKAIEPDICIAPLEDLEFNYAKCLVGNTKVMTTKGIKNIRDVKVNDKIWQKNDFKNVGSIIKYKQKKTLKLITKDGYEIEGTLNHKIRSNDNFKMLKDFKIGDKCDLGFFKYPSIINKKLSAPLFLTKKLNSIDFDKLDETLLPKIEINKRWGRFIGYILGDGHLRVSDSVSISQDIRYDDVIDDILDFVTKIGINNFKVKKKDSEYGVDLVFSSRNLKWFLSKKIGFTERSKKILRVPNIIWKSPKSVIKEFIRGLFESDGTVNKTSCSFTSKNLELVKDIQFLLMGFGIRSKICSDFNKVYKKYYHRLLLKRQACDIFYREINFISKRKKKKLKEIVIRRHGNSYKEWKMKDVVVEIQEGINDVYDIEVPENNFYLANGIISHNSNIKALEYVALGAPSVFSDVEPYSNCNLKAKTDEEMIAHIERLAGDINYRAKIFKKDKAKIRTQLFWEEHDNVKKYINTYLNMFGHKL